MFDLPMIIIKNKTDVFMVVETETDNSFLISQFIIAGYSISFRLDQTDKSCGWSTLICLRGCLLNLCKDY